MSPFPLRMSLAFVLALVTAAAAAADGPSVDVPALIDKLTDVADSDVGYSASSWGRPFLPLDCKGAWSGGVLFQKPEVPSDTLRAIVKRGAAAVPHLIAHLDDKRPTKITVTHNFGPLGGLFHGGFCDYNARTAKEDPNAERSDDEGDDSPLDHDGPAGSHVLTVGDLCFVAIGQIVNRRFDAVRYQPTAIVIVTSPTASPALRAAVKKEWGGLTAERLKASLIDDFQKPDSPERRVGACKRLAYYYPDALEPLALKFLDEPTYDRWHVEQFVHADLYAADGLKQLHERFKDYIAKHGEASRDGILLQLFDDLQGLEAKERGARNKSADEYGDKPRRLLIELYGEGKDIKSADVPLVDTPSTGDKGRLIEEGLIYDDSAKIDGAVRGLLAATDDDYFALACMKRLVGRGFDEDIEKYCRRRLPLLDKEHKMPFQEMLDKAGWTRLHTAVERGDADEVRRRIAEGMDVNAAAKDGQTPLHLAAEAGDLQTARALLDGKADLNPKDGAGKTPVQRAAWEDREEVVLLLAERGCQLPDVLSAVIPGETEVVESLLKKDPKQATATNARGGTPLHLAARWGRVKTMAALLAAGAAVDARDGGGWAPLHYAAAEGREDAMRLLLENKADPDALNRSNEWSPLHLAILSGKPELVSLLIDHKANPDIAKDGENGSPLHLAVNKDLPDMVAALLDKGATVDLKNQDGWTPLHLAAQAGREDVTRVLLDHKADVGARDATGRTPLHTAAAWRQKGTVVLLLDKGADVNATSNDGATPLYDALEYAEGTDVALVLLEHEAKSRVGGGKLPSKPLHLAAAARDRVAVKLLLGQGEPVDARDDDGTTALHWAAGAADVGVLQELLDNGAPVNVQAKDGSTPLHFAVKGGNAAVVVRLLDYEADPTIKNTAGETPLDCLPTKGEPAKRAAQIKGLLEPRMPKK